MRLNEVRLLESYAERREVRLLILHRAEKKGLLYVVGRYFCLALPGCSLAKFAKLFSWLCMCTIIILRGRGLY